MTYTPSMEAMQEMVNTQGQTLAHLTRQIDRLARFILSLDCGFPTINDQYPNGMSATEAAEEYIKTLRGPTPDTVTAQPGEWISVEERLPEIVREWKDGPHTYGESALLLMWTGHIQLTGFYFKGGTWAEFYGQTVRPTHWQPLPAPPSGATQGDKEK